MLPSKRFICSRSIVWFLLAVGVISAGKVCADQTFDPTNPNKVWDTTTKNWDASADAWLNDGTSNAIFTGTAQTLDVNGGINVNNITFNSNGWNIGDPTANGSLALGAPSTITVTNSTDTATLGVGIISGALTKAGAGTLVLSGTNTFTGNVIVGTGILKVANNSALGDTTGTTSVTSGASLVLTNGVTVTNETIGINGSGINNAGALQADAGASATWAGTITIDSQGGRVGAQSGGTLTISGVIQNGASNPSGVLAIGEAAGSTAPGVVIISGTSNTYSGLTQIVRGVLKLGATNALPATTIVDVSSSTSATEDCVFDLNGFSQTITGLQRTNTFGTSSVTNNGATPSTLTITGGANPFTGVIKDGTSTVAITKSVTGTLTLAGANTYSGATNVTGGTLSLTGSITGTAINVSGGTAGGALTEASTGVIGGASTLIVSSGNFPAGLPTFTAGATLGGANAFTGAVTVGAAGNAGVLFVTNNLGLGSTTAGTMVTNGQVVLGNGVTVTGETITVNGNGTNNNGALQSAPSTSATWAGSVVVASPARIGGGDNGTLTISGIISGASSSPIVFSRGTNAVTILSAQNTYTGDTTLFANAGTGAVLRLGVDNAINAASRLIPLGGTQATANMTLDLNGHILTLRALDTTGQPNSASKLFISNSAATASVLTISSPTTNPTDQGVFAGTIQDGTGGISLVKAGINTQTLTGNDTYTGNTTINSGTLQIGLAAAGNTAGSLASTSFNLNGGIFTLNNAGATNNNANRISDSANFSSNGGSFLFTGSDQATTNSSELINSFALTSAISKITVTFGATNTATVTLNTLTRPANGGIAVVNGVNLGKDGTSTASVARLLVNTAPTLVGTTDDAGTGDVSVKNTKIVPFLLGSVASGTGGTGTGTGLATDAVNTFVTWSATGGLRPLNLTDEFTQNAFIAGNNTRLTSAVNPTGSVSINSLIIEGANTATVIPTGQTLTVASGAILFSSTGTNAGISGGTLAFGSSEGIITINAAPNTTIGSIITGSAGVSYYGTGTLVLAAATQPSTYSGNTLLAVGTVIPQASSLGPAGAPTSGPFGTGTVIFGGSQMRATTSVGGITIGNPVSFAADTTIISAGGSDQPLTFTGPVTLSGNRTLTQLSVANTTFSGNIGDGGNGFGLTITGTGTGPVVLGGTDNYSGPTAIKATVVVTGSLSGSAVTVGDASSLSKAAVLGGSGTVGNVTVGAIAGNTGATLKPHEGSASTSTGTTFHAGSVTFANSAAHLSLLIGRTSAFTGLGSDGAAGGDVSDHLSTTGALTLNGADLQLSLLTTTGYTPVNGDLFFLTINSGGAINGTFSSLNGTATNLSEGATFALGTQAYEITYLASYSANSFTGGNDIALLAVIPEPGTLVSLLGGLGCLLGAQRFRRTRQSGSQREG